MAIALRPAESDAGYGAAANLEALAELRIDAYIAPRRERDPVAAAAPWRLIPQAMAIEPRMARKLRTQAARAVRKRRKPVAGPPFGVIKQAMGFRRFHMRGLTKVQGEWQLVTTAYHLRRLHASGWTPAPRPPGPKSPGCLRRGSSTLPGLPPRSGGSARSYPVRSAALSHTDS
ncbi:MAG TPA: transposase [Candidatus Dormibacteraeota bacterium]|nr:transposase [Candidatus Dormibacteraeota bacterium]